MKNAWAIGLIAFLVLASSSFAWAAMDSSMDHDMMGEEEPAKTEHESMQSEELVKAKTVVIDKQTYELKPIIPKGIRKGQLTTITLQVLREDRPAEGFEPLLMANSFFTGHDKTGGEDSKAEEKHGTSHGTSKSDSNETDTEQDEHGVMGTPSGPGKYSFRWIPEADGRFNLTFILNPSQMKEHDEMEANDHAEKDAGGAQSDGITIPIDVKPPAPDYYVLGSFGAFVIAILSYSTLLRRQERLGVL